MKPLKLTTFDSPVGNIIIGGDGESVYFVKMGELSDRDEWIEKWRLKHDALEPEFVEGAYSQVIDEFNQYFNGTLSQFSFKMSLSGTDFQKRVWKTLEEIPFGEQWTYKDIAKSIGNTKALRAVGGAINKNPISIAIPCHRVIGSDGSLTGYASGLDHKRFLLHHETSSEHWLHQTS